MIKQCGPQLALVIPDARAERTKPQVSLVIKSSALQDLVIVYKVTCNVAGRHFHSVSLIVNIPALQNSVIVYSTTCDVTWRRFHTVLLHVLLHATTPTAQHYT